MARAVWLSMCFLLWTGFFMGLAIGCPTHSAAAEPAPAAAATSAAKAPQVMVSIRPLYSLVLGVMEGVGTPVLLVPGNQSPHHFSLNPSQAKALQDADLVFLVNREFENFLETPLRNIAPTAEVVELSRASGITLRPYRRIVTLEGVDSEDAHKEHDHTNHDHAEHNHEGHSHEAMDYHLWLDPQYASRMVDLIATTLMRKDPAHAQQYKVNAVKLNFELDALYNELFAALHDMPSADKNTVPYLTYHDAYQYFEARFNLQPARAITRNPEYSLGVKSLQSLQEALRGKKLRCIIREPQFDAAITERLAERFNAKIHTLNPDGSTFQDDKQAYFDLVRSIGKTLIECSKP